MKRNRLQRRAQIDVEELTTHQKMHLTFGHCLLDVVPFRDDDHRRAVWNAHRALIIGDYIREYPGRRPVAWWVYSATEPRRLADGLVLQDPGDWRRHHGCRGGNQATQNKHETESAYLRRLGLLGADEAYRLDDLAYSPRRR